MATFIAALLGWLKGSAQLLGWLLSVVVIPLTMWLTVLKQDVKTTIKDQEKDETSVAQKFHDLDTYNSLQDAQLNAFKDGVMQKLNEISGSIGELKGEVRRIPR